MSKLLKNLHWIIIAIAGFNFYQLYTAADEHYVNIVEQEERKRVELAKNKKTVREINNYYNNIKEEKEKIERVAKEIEKMQQLLPSDVSDAENVNLLRKLAEDINVKELSIVPEGESDRGFFIARKYRLKARATFLQFLIIFEKISENKRILNIGESAFRISNTPQRGKFQVIEGEFVLEAYRFNANYKEDRGIDAIEKKFQEDSKAQRAPRPKPPKAKDKDAGGGE